jgi:hypothetical protein
MASLRGATALWNAVVVNSNDASSFATPGPGPFVAVYFQTDKDATFKIQASATVSVSPGLNASDTSEPDGDLIWCDYDGATSIAVTANTPLCFDLSPFGPQFIRIVCVTGTNVTTTALVSSFGPN